MNLKHLDRLWRETCPDEVKGLVMNKRRRRIYDERLERSKNRKRLAELNKQEKEKS
tara:strand:- start:212 stop:379 length:168 start_codon:yes stop_codon:yes gene_type:complete